MPFHRNKGKDRNCPDLNTWDAFINYEIGNGMSIDGLKPNIKLPKFPKMPTANDAVKKVLGVDTRGYNQDLDDDDEKSANAQNFLKRSFLHPGRTKCEEQKREAREDYEERCEPSFPLFRNSGHHRFCPDINSWQEFDNYEIGNGYDSHVTPPSKNNNRHKPDHTVNDELEI
ncbi:unnamed protein product [Didymodactylos carnosus]|uniref:Uncharacterized protein n=1 Tax=Didymodactylos carnosus TaxID=1234261 RepID=A0A814HYI7_9BILA|nr:unnamed protein product [Didymodactylos carnosus]CAF1158111.1 unnamed protein product [Didymodactylos carnosus]CAF3786334.1 unnamed protein product [Didymodactylos carnosus]CAF3969646.1 unnamed protein product [Didymodactylos carnosus]